ncbi:16S rRNA (guanine(527)-N(7))-methyltransferase RsmG [Rubrobacter tropicus]|uniref:Ribosomal RNA small subunit methyltransferase G n=1 Tax=Rubrobacter tropicus TaxID=2653851 RepID=A0A6G8QES6_9ACTN|nr:16S rRNA (guanine(527)-N(7))-methyltransferase RsmG [Rubrobacter tropicus]QIN84953.1 16S rRNA (guanine(527)-N(7))-methyltransferase RsmG [Rubrobacter tropicus]
MSAVETFGKQLIAWGIDLPAGTEMRLYEFAGLLGSYDAANVIGTRELDRIFLEHVLDSMSCLLFPGMKSATRVADVGSGGGLPAVPLAVALPDVKFTLLESTGKKATFLRHTAEKLGLSNVEVVNERVESVGHDPLRRATQDVCTVRAVAKLPVLAEYCLPLLEMGGHVVSMKGQMSDEEYEEGERAARLLGGIVLQTIEVPILAELEQKTRRLIVLKKVEETPDAYPRRVGTPAKKPLGRA